MGYRDVLPIMLMTGMWMTGCAGSQKPKLAPANTALGTLQRAELKLKEGKKAQKSQDYKVALASHLQAVEMAESVSTKYPKDPNTAKFLKKPMLGKVWVDDVKLKTIPLLRQQSLISEDILGWAIAEIEQLEADQRLYAYQSLFNALFRGADIKRLEWFINDTKEKVPQKTSYTWKGRVEQLKVFLKNTPNFATRASIFNKVFNSTKALETQHQRFFEQTLKEPNQTTKLVLLRAMYEHLARHPKSALAKDSAIQKRLLAERLWTSRHQHSTYPVASYLQAVLKDHKMFGFESKQAMGQHLLALIQKRAWDEKKINAMYALVDKTEVIRDITQQQRLLVANTNALLQRFDPNSKIHNALLTTGFFALTNKQSATPTTLRLAEQLLKKKPGETNWAKRLKRLQSKIAITEGKTADINTLKPIPKLGPDDKPLYANIAKIIAPLNQYAIYTARLRDLGDKRSLKALADQLKTAQNNFETWATQTNLRAGSTKPIIAKFYQQRAAIAAALGDTKTTIAHLKKITTLFKASEYVLDESFAITTRFAITAKRDKTQQAALDEQIAIVASSATFKHAIDYYRAWLEQKIQQHDTSLLDKWFDGIYEGLPQIRGLEQFTMIYAQSKLPRDKKISQWIVGKLQAISFKRYQLIKLNGIAQMCQMPQHNCMDQLITFFKSGKLSETGQRHVIEEMLDHDKVDIAKQLIPHIPAGKHQWIARSTMLQWQLKRTGDYATAKPKLEALLKKMADTQQLNQADWSAFYKVFTATGRCPELNALLDTPALETIDATHAAQACLKSRFNYAHDHPAATLRLINKVNTKKRLDFLVSFIGRYGVIEHPTLKKVRQEVAASKN